MANDPRFEVYPQHMTVRPALADHPTLGLIETAARSEPTGQFGWRFRAANGQIAATSGEGFTRREDAHRAIEDFLLGLKAAGLVIVAGDSIIRPAFIDVED